MLRRMWAVRPSLLELALIVLVLLAVLLLLPGTFLLAVAVTVFGYVGLAYVEARRSAGGDRT